MSKTKKKKSITESKLLPVWLALPLSTFNKQLNPEATGGGGGKGPNGPTLRILAYGSQVEKSVIGNASKFSL